MNNPRPILQARALRQALGENARELIECLQHHQELTAQLEELGHDAGMPTCPIADCPRRRRYRALLLETIEVLEATRRNFKSKQLENLRKRLIAVLAQGE